MTDIEPRGLREYLARILGLLDYAMADEWRKSAAEAVDEARADLRALLDETAAEPMPAVGRHAYFGNVCSGFGAPLICMICQRDMFDPIHDQDEDDQPAPEPQPEPTPDHASYTHRQDIAAGPSVDEANQPRSTPVRPVPTSTGYSFPRQSKYPPKWRCR
jgi:hypothetical protein